MGLTTVRPGRMCERHADADIAADLGFRRADGAANGNPVLVDLTTGLVRRGDARIDDHPGGFPGHDELADAIEAGDPLAAADSCLAAARALLNP